jgi:tRNA (guanine-N7-)-methyltransferase
MDTSGPDKHEKRTIRSFVRRTGRLTPAQARALDELWPGFGCEPDSGHLDLNLLFGRAADKVLEIGFGNGETFVLQAQENPQADYLGIEVHRPGVGHCLMQANKAAVKNLRVIQRDAITVLEQQIGDGALRRINLYFPDPWPKKRHHKRRIVQAPFLDLCVSRLERGGSLHIATDWDEYAEHIDAEIDRRIEFVVADRRRHHGENALDRPTTKFEKRGLKKGHGITDWRLDKI